MTSFQRSRRSFMAKAALAGAAAATVPPIGRAMAEEQSIALPASAANRCGTCEFWGGPRQISADRKQVTATGLGYCNNPKSPMYQKKTPADHQMEAWKKWEALNS